MDTSERKTAIVFCCEYGILEKVTPVMVKSLKKYGGVSSSSELICFCPRKFFKPGKNTIHELEKLGVRIVQEDLVTTYSYYPLYNKPVITAYVEKYVDAEQLIFIDSDMIVLQNLFKDPQLGQSNVAIQKEFVGVVAAKDEEDINYSYWKKIFNELGVNEGTVNHTFVDDQKMLAYWNSGLIFSRRSNGLMSAWKENLFYLLSKYHWRNLEYFFLEQATLAATIHQLDLSVYELNNEYNYPISLHEKVCFKNKAVMVDDLVAIHYLKEYKKTINNLRSLGGSQEKVDWLEEEFKRMNLLAPGPVSMAVDFLKRQRNVNLQKALYFYKKFRDL